MISVLVVDDDFRVAAVHAALVDRVDGMRTVGTAHTAAAALASVTADRPDLILLDNYLPDRLGVDLLPDLRCDSLLISADARARTIRSAFAAGALGYLIKPFVPATLTERLVAYTRYRALLSSRNEITQEGVDRAIAALHVSDRPQSPKGQSPATARLVAGALIASTEPRTAADLAEQLGIARATSQRYLSALVDAGEAMMTLRYGSAGRPEHRYSAVAR